MVWETQAATRWKAQQYEESELRGEAERLGALEAPAHWAASQGSGGSQGDEKGHQEDHKVINFHAVEVVEIILSLFMFRSSAQQEDDEDDELEFKLVIPPAPKLEDETFELPYEEPPM